MRSSSSKTFLIAGDVAVAAPSSSSQGHVLLRRCPECDGAGFVRKSGVTLRAPRRDHGHLTAPRAQATSPPAPRRDRGHLTAPRAQASAHLLLPRTPPPLVGEPAAISSAHPSSTRSSLNGTLPPSLLLNATELRALSLAGNDLTGALPDAAAYSRGLQELNLSTRSPAGSPPRSWREFKVKEAMAPPPCSQGVEMDALVRLEEARLRHGGAALQAARCSPTRELPGGAVLALPRPASVAMVSRRGARPPEPAERGHGKKRRERDQPVGQGVEN